MLNISDSLFDLGAPNWSQWDKPWKAKDVAAATASKWLASWHYLGTLPGGSIPWGAYCPDLISLVCIGQTSNANGVIHKFQLEAFPKGNLEITRVVTHPDAPKNSTTKAVAAAMRRYGEAGYDWLFSYADTGQGHHGGIYQALNGVYVGKNDERQGYMVTAPGETVAKRVHPRSMVAMWGSHSKATRDQKEREGYTIEVVPMAPKHLYILPVSKDASVRRAIRQALAPFVQPYPKRQENAA